MAIAKITLIGLDQYTNGSIWKKFSMPEGIDAEVAKMEILKACAEFPLLYTDADFVAGLIGHICSKWKASFIRWQAVSVAQYNALYNVDADITVTDETTGKRTTSGSGTATNKVASYDSNTFQNRDESTVANSSEANDTEKTVHTESRKGNIGVTKSQDLLLSEIDLWRWNMYEEIAEIFVTELTIPVYS